MLREAGLLGSEEESKEDREMRALWKHFDADGSGCAGQPAATSPLLLVPLPLLLLLVGIGLSDSGHRSSSCSPCCACLCCTVLIRSGLSLCLRCAQGFGPERGCGGHARHGQGARRCKHARPLPSPLSPLFPLSPLLSDCSSLRKTVRSLSAGVTDVLLRLRLNVCVDCAAG